MRIVVIVDGSASSLSRGARFGAVEARHAAQLLRRELVIDVLEASAGRVPGDAAGADVLVLASSDQTVVRSGLGSAALRGTPVVLSDTPPGIDSELACTRTAVAVQPSLARLSAAADEWSAASDELPAMRVPGTGVELDEALARLRADVPEATVLVPGLEHSPGANLEGLDVVAPLSWLANLRRFGAAQLNARYSEQHREPFTAEAWRGWMAVKVAWETLARAEAGGAAQLLTGRLARFDGHKGRALTVGADRRLRQPLYLARRTGRGEWQLLSEVGDTGSAEPLVCDNVPKER